MMTGSHSTDLGKPHEETADRSNFTSIEPDAYPTTANFNGDTDATIDGHSQAAKRPRSKPDPKSAKEIFLDTFSVSKDKDGNIKRASISQTALKTLQTETADLLDNGFIDKLCMDAVQTDPELSCLTEIALTAMQRKDADKRDMLFTACIRMASGTWIHSKSDDQIDLYDNIFREPEKIENLIVHLEKKLAERFNKRITSLSKRDYYAQPKSVTTTTVDQASSTNPQIKKSVTKKSLLSQQGNLITLGILWLIQKNQIDTEVVVDYFLDHINQGSKTEISLYEVSVYLAEQRLKPDTLLLKTLSRLREKRNLLNEDNKQLQNKISQLERDKSQAEVRIDGQQQQIARLESERLQLSQDADQLRLQIQEQELDARADRTHLRDDEKRVRAKAFNLMTEDVLEPLKLALVVLQREKPKVESAAYQIESAIDSIERELKWFKG